MVNSDNELELFTKLSEPVINSFIIKMIKSLSVSETGLVRLYLKDNSTVIVNVEDNKILTKDSFGKIDKRTATTHDDCELVKYAKFKKSQLDDEMCR